MWSLLVRLFQYLPLLSPRAIRKFASCSCKLLLPLSRSSHTILQVSVLQVAIFSPLDIAADRKFDLCLLLCLRECSEGNDFVTEVGVMTHVKSVRASLRLMASLSTFSLCSLCSRVFSLCSLYFWGIGCARCPKGAKNGL